MRPSIDATRTLPQPPARRRVSSFWRNLQSWVAIWSAVTFFGIGALAVAPVEQKVAVAVALLATWFAFRVRVSALAPSILRAGHNTQTRSAFITPLIVVGAVTAALYLAVFSIYPIPVLSDNVEVLRLTPVIELGPVYRFMNDALFTAAALVVVCRVRLALGRRTAALLLAGIAGAVFSLGFRSRVADLALVCLIAACVAAGPDFRLPRIGLRRALKVSLGVGAIAIVIVYITSLRSGVPLVQAWYEVVDRTFLLNYRTNFARIFAYTTNEGFSLGATFVTDIFALVTGRPSMQQEVTEYFNSVNSAVFTMTPTVFGEAFLNFGWAGPLAVFPVLLGYRFVFERSLRMAARVAPPPLALAVLANYLYYVPRSVATAGISGAFLIKSLSLAMVLLACGALSSILVDGRR